MAKSLSVKRLFLECSVVLLLILLAREWIHTLPSFTDTDAAMLKLFSWPFTILILVHRLLPWRWVRFGASLLFVLIWYQQTLWTDVGFFSLDWVKGTFIMIKDSSFDILRMDWMAIDPILRTGLFYLLIWVAAFLIYVHVLVRRKVLAILLVTILFFSILDTFMMFDGKWPIVKVFLYGFAILAIMNLNRVEGLINRRVTHLRLTPWFIAAFAVLIVVGSIAYLVPKSGPSWPDPVAFITSLKSGSDGGGAGTATSGYGKSDTLLGGSFIQTDNLILEAEFKGTRYPSHYWRGESKEVYTGSGWETKQSRVVPFNFYTQNPHMLFSSLEQTEIFENVVMHEPTNLFFASGQPKIVMPKNFLINDEIKGSAPNVSAVINTDTYRIYAADSFVRYDTTSFIPKISEEQLIDISERYVNSTSNYPDEIMDVYTQLPDTLPDRVKKLADQIVGDETNIYRKAKKIEYYLRWSGYQYRTDNIPYPEEGQDFVDQFLFDTKRGYCDHFSTSMIVMLRTQGIPARWVKGYTFGEVESLTADTHVVKVKGKNAHSWVEVYFPEAGWVPFEPTSSFTFPYEVLRGEAQMGSQPTSVPLDLYEQLIEDTEQDQEQEPIAKGNSGSGTNGSTPWMIVGFVALLVGVLGFFFRDILVLQIQAALFAKEQDNRLIYKGYYVLMKWLGRLFGVRSDEQTIREYTAGLKLKEEQEELAIITQAFEETRYGEKEASLSRGEFIDTWRRLLKKLRS